MTTIHITTHSRVSPERVLAAGYDFSARRAEIFPAVSIPYLEVHELSQTFADVTEGTPAGSASTGSDAGTTGRSPAQSRQS